MYVGIKAKQTDITGIVSPLACVYEIRNYLQEPRKTRCKELVSYGLGMWLKIFASGLMCVSNVSVNLFT